MKLLSALDALFLHLETAEQPMHVGGLNLFTMPEGYKRDFYQDVREHLVSRMHLAPVFHRKLATMPMGLTNPGWLKQIDLDVDWHIQNVKLPRPGSIKQLHAFIAKAHAELLPRDRPLWRAYVIQGLSNGQLGFYAKFHHAALDGQGGVALAKAILDLEAKPPARPGRPAETAAKRSAASPSTGALLAASFRGLMGQYAELVRAAPQITSSIKNAMQGGLGDSFSTGNLNAASIKASIAGLVGPRTRLNVAIGKQRAFATASFPLGEVKAIGKMVGGSLNDAVLGIVAGGLRGFLKSHDELPSKALICAMPVSLRSDPNVNAGSIDNQSSMVLTSLATDLADPIKRLQAVIESTQKAKQVSAAMKAGLPTDMPSLGIPWLLTGLTKLYTSSKIANRLPPVANVVVSNVPGPPIPLYMAGAQMQAYYPVSIVVHGIALNITLQSYNGRLDFGLLGCAKALPDISRLAEFLEESFEELKVHLVQQQVAQAKPKSQTTPAVKKVREAKTAPKNGANQAVKAKPVQATAIKATAVKTKAVKTKAVKAETAKSTAANQSASSRKKG